MIIKPEVALLESFFSLLARWQSARLMSFGSVCTDTPADCLSVASVLHTWKDEG